MSIERKEFKLQGKYIIITTTWSMKWWKSDKFTYNNMAMAVKKVFIVASSPSPLRKVNCEHSQVGHFDVFLFILYLYSSCWAFSHLTETEAN